MNSSDTPSRITKAFGVNGLKNTIPVDSSTTTDNDGVATFDKGFPPVTMQPLSAGGIPPSGKDMNGALYSTTIQQQWQNAGMGFTFNGDFSSAINGYPKGAIIPSTSLSGTWLNTLEGNNSNPESPTGANTGWVPFNSYGINYVTVNANSSTVLSSLQAQKERIVLSGSLTANITVIFPSYIKIWNITNRTTGDYSITLRTVTGTGVTIRNGDSVIIFCDGVNITFEFGTAAQRNVGNSDNQIPDMSYFQSSGSYQRMPSGILIQWGVARCGGSGSESSGVLNTFPTPFSQGLINLTLSHIGFSPSGAGVLSYLPSGSGKTGFYGYSSVASQSAPVNANYVAIGI